MDIFRCVLGFNKAADRHFPPKFTSGNISGSRIQKSQANLRETNPEVSKMASSCCRGRKKTIFEPQTNKITDYLSAKFDASSIVTDVLEQLIDTCNPVCCSCQILFELITNFETESSHHSGENMSEKM